MAKTSRVAMASPIYREFSSIVERSPWIAQDDAARDRAARVLRILRSGEQPASALQVSVDAMFAVWVDPRLRHKAEGIGQAIIAELQRRGAISTTDLLTAQEHYLVGGTLSYFERQPFQPEGYLEAIKSKLPHEVVTAKLHDIKAARFRTGGLPLYPAHLEHYFGIEAAEGYKFTLEPLTRNGCTVRDPQLIDPAGRIVPTAYTASFPHLRHYRRRDIAA